MPLIMKVNREGLSMFFMDWQILALRYLLNIYPAGANNKTVWANVNASLKGSISRASIIKFFNYMADDNFLEYEVGYGQGGYYRIYRIKFIEPELKTLIAERFISKLLNEYPQATRKVLQNM